MGAGARADKGAGGPGIVDSVRKFLLDIDEFEWGVWGCFKSWYSIWIRLEIVLEDLKRDGIPHHRSVHDS